MLKPEAVTLYLYMTLYWQKNDEMSFFKFWQKKVLRLDIERSCTTLDDVWVGICKKTCDKTSKVIQKMPI